MAQPLNPEPHRRPRLHRPPLTPSNASASPTSSSTSWSRAPPWTSAQASSAAKPQTFADFDQLYRYCYLVASVVGLVCIRIFGYTDPRAEKLAEETGIAFQLTNILRDVKEDAERNRIYLPLDLLRRLRSSPRPAPRPHDRCLAPAKSPRHAAAPSPKKPRTTTLAANQLLPLIDRDSRAALWVLVTIYHRSSSSHRRTDYDVFSQRVSVPTTSKLTTLARGAAMALAQQDGILTAMQQTSS